MLRVYTYEPGSKMTTQKRTLELPTTEDLSAIDLGFIRGVLSDNGVFESPEYGLFAPFKEAICLTNYTYAAQQLPFVIPWARRCPMI